MNSLSPHKPVPESITAGLARSEAQIGAGQTVPLQPVLDRLRSSIARMQADLEGMDWGSLVAPAVAARTTQLYDRRAQEVTLDGVERVLI